MKALEQQIAESNQAVTMATKDRAGLALDGDHGAIAKIKTARAHQHDAE